MYVQSFSLSVYFFLEQHGFIEYIPAPSLNKYYTADLENM